MALNEKRILEKVNSRFVVSIYFWPCEICIYVYHFCLYSYFSRGITAALFCKDPFNCENFSHT